MDNEKISVMIGSVAFKDTVVNGSFKQDVSFSIAISSTGFPTAWNYLLGKSASGMPLHMRIYKVENGLISQRLIYTESFVTTFELPGLAFNKDGAKVTFSVSSGTPEIILDKQKFNMELIKERVVNVNNFHLKLDNLSTEMVRSVSKLQMVVDRHKPSNVHKVSGMVLEITGPGTDWREWFLQSASNPVKRRGKLTLKSSTNIEVLSIVLSDMEILSYTNIPRSEGALEKSVVVLRGTIGPLIAF